MTFNDFFKSIPILETGRLVLRGFTYDDIDRYLEFFSDPDVQEYLGELPIPKDIKSARQWVDNMNGRCLASKLVITWCIELKSKKEVIGRIDLGGFVRKSMADIA
jgi:ribosomal-protein-alanine N-acetyltransferase